MPKYPTHAPFDIPREITIRGKRWLVAYDLELSGNDKYDARARMELGRRGHLRGTCNPAGRRGPQREIHLSAYSNQHPFASCVTFLHEVTHAVSAEVSPCQPIGMPAEEKLLHAIDTDLTKVLAQLNWRKPGE